MTDLRQLVPRIAAMFDMPRNLHLRAITWFSYATASGDAPASIFGVALPVIDGMKWHGILPNSYTEALPALDGLVEITRLTCDEACGSLSGRA